MPVILLLATLAIAYWVVENMLTKTVTAYVNGVPSTISVAPVGSGAYLRTDCAASFKAMASACNDACGETLELSGPRAGFRTPSDQASLIVEEGSFGAGGLAAAVNASPHQTGTAADFNGLDPSNSNYNAALREWMDVNAGTYGWTNNGANWSTRELWHWQWNG